MKKSAIIKVLLGGVILSTGVYTYLKIKKNKK